MGWLVTSDGWKSHRQLLVWSSQKDWTSADAVASPRRGVAYTRDVHTAWLSTREP